MCLGEIGQVSRLFDDRAELVCASRVLVVGTMTLDEPVAVGDWLLAHSGLALTRLDPAEATAALEMRATRRADEAG